MDDYRLLVIRKTTKTKSPYLRLVDTGKFVGTTPAQTVLHLSPCFAELNCPDILLGRGAHKPSLVEPLAPFHPDPSQRIAVLHNIHPFFYLVLRVGPLLELLENREGSEIAWDKWKCHAFIPSNLQPGSNVHVCVSGCRMFSLRPEDSGSGVQLEVYDFSVLGRTNYLNGTVHKYLNGVRRLSSTGVRGHLRTGSIIDVYSGHDTITFNEVSVAILLRNKTNLDLSYPCSESRRWRVSPTSANLLTQLRVGDPALGLQQLRIK